MPSNYPGDCFAVWLLLGCSALSGTRAIAQDFQISPEQMQKLTPEQRKQVMEQMRKRGKQEKPPASPKEEEPAEKEEDKKKEETKKEDEIKTIKRPTDKPNPLDVDRVKLQVDANGLVQFNYNGHPWSAVLQDYADAARLNFDWQELPADYLNLITHRKYSLPEARDLLNRHLLARGFTMIVHGEVLSAVKVDKLDPSLPRRIKGKHVIKSGDRSVAAHAVDQDLPQKV